MVQPGILCSPGWGMWHRLLQHTGWLVAELLPDFQAEGLPGLTVLSPVWRSPSCPGEAALEEQDSSSLSGMHQPGAA